MIGELPAIAGTRLKCDVIDQVMSARMLVYDVTHLHPTKVCQDLACDEERGELSHSIYKAMSQQAKSLLEGESDMLKVSTFL